MKLLAALLGDSDLGSGLFQEPVANGVHFVGGAGLGNRFLELLLGLHQIDRVGRNRFAGEQRHLVIGHLDETAIDVKSGDLSLKFDPELAIAEPTDHRGMIHRDPQLAVEQGDDDKAGGGLQDRFLRRNDDAFDAGHD